MVKLTLANKQIDTGGPLRRRDMPRVLRILANRILLDISDCPGALDDHETSNTFFGIDTRRVLREYLIESQRFARPPLDDVRIAKPSMHQRQIAAAKRSKVNHRRPLDQ